MQLYLEGGAWFKKKSPLEKISFLVDWPLSERAIKCQQASWPENDVKPLRPLYNFIWSTWFWQRSGLLTPRDSVFIPMYNKKYISKPENKEIRSVSGKTDSPVSFFLSPSGWIPIWSVDAIPCKPSYSASFSPLIFLLYYPFLISLYICN